MTKGLGSSLGDHGVSCAGLQKSMNGSIGAVITVEVGISDGLGRGGISDGLGRGGISDGLGEGRISDGLGGGGDSDGDLRLGGGIVGEGE